MPGNWDISVKYIYLYEMEIRYYYQDPDDDT